MFDNTASNAELPASRLCSLSSVQSGVQAIDMFGHRGRYHHLPTVFPDPTPMREYIHNRQQGTSSFPELNDERCLSTSRASKRRRSSLDNRNFE